MRRLLLFCLLACAALPAGAQEWPSGRVTIVVPYPPGGTSDIPARLAATQIAAATGATVIVDNRPGAAGRLGSRQVADAAPNGLTLLAGNNGSHIIQPLLSTTIRYDPLADFTPIVITAESNNFIGIAPNLPAANLAEFVALLKREPGRHSYGSAGVGSFGNFMGEILKLATGTDIVHVPYRGSAAAATDLAAGRIAAMLDPIVLPMRAQGVRVLATFSPQRFSGEPDIPTAAEAGVPGIVMTGWFALFGPRGLPQPIVARINAIVNQGMQSPEAVETLRRSGLSPVALSPADFAARIAADMRLYGEIRERAQMGSIE
jgi:tripartite-type tricarboxylate transporter receptor subunit TctC